MDSNGVGLILSKLGTTIRQVAFTILTVPTVVIWATVLIGALLDRPIFEVLGISRLVGAIPFFNFVTSIALNFVFPNMKEWRIATVVNSIPIGLILLLFTFFFVIGYHG